MGNRTGTLQNPHFLLTQGDHVLISINFIQNWTTASGCQGQQHLFLPAFPMYVHTRTRGRVNRHGNTSNTKQEEPCRVMVAHSRELGWICGCSHLAQADVTGNRESKCQRHVLHIVRHAPNSAEPAPPLQHHFLPKLFIHKAQLRVAAEANLRQAQNAPSGVGLAPSLLFRGLRPFTCRWRGSCGEVRPLPM